ncbi:MAG: hypothetical protein HRT45_18605 [Bdellovibrionales bacterium]|nr:hypothetical protein [Bdellovibrionales bacterium]
MKNKNALMKGLIACGLSLLLTACPTEKKGGKGKGSGVDSVSIAKIGGKSVQLCSRSVNMPALETALNEQLRTELGFRNDLEIDEDYEEYFFDAEHIYTEGLTFAFLNFRAIYCRSEAVTLALRPSSMRGWTLFQYDSVATQASETGGRQALTAVPSTHYLSLDKKGFLRALETGKVSKNQLVRNPDYFDREEGSERYIEREQQMPEEFSVSVLSLLGADIKQLNQSSADLAARLLKLLDSSILSGLELQNQIDFSRASQVRGEQLDEDFGLYSSYWSTQFERERLQTLQKANLTVYQAWVGVDGINRLVYEKQYENLKALAVEGNVNTVSRVRYRNNYSSRLHWRYGSKAIQLIAGVTTYGLSPLMVAAVLKDDQAIEILKAVEGIELGLQSPMLGSATWSGIYDGSITLGSISGYQGSWDGSGSVGYLGSGGSFGGNNGGGPGGFNNGGGGAPRTQKSPEELARQRCPGCTALMVAINEGHCQQVHSIVESNAAIANQPHSNGKSPIEFSLDRDARCLVDLVQNNSKFVKNVTAVEGQMAALWRVLSRFSPEVLRAVPDAEWQGLTDAQKAYLARLEFGTQRSTNAAIFKRMTRLEVVNRAEYHSIFAEYLEKLINRNTTEYTINPLEKFQQMKDLGFDPNSVTGTFGHTIFDFLLHFRGAEKAITNNRHNRLELFELDTFDENLDRILEIEPSWLTTWVNGQSFFGYNPISLLAAYNEQDMLRSLNKIPGRNLETRCAKSGYTAVNWSVMRMKFVDIPLYEGVNITFTPNGWNGMWHLLVGELGAEEVHDFESGREIKPALNEKFDEILAEFRAMYDAVDRHDHHPIPFEVKWFQTRSK